MMPDGARLHIEALAIMPEAHSVAPSIVVRLRASIANAALVHALVLRARIRLHAGGRAYTAEERDRLAPLFGEASQWAKSTRSPVSWAETSVATGRFEKTTEIDLVVPCTYDLSIATTKLFDALDGGTLPLSISFSGTIFCEDAAGLFCVQPIPSDVEARIDLAMDMWRSLMQAHHPDGALLRLPRELADRVRRCGGGGAGGVSTLERTIERLVNAEEQRSL